MRQKLLGTEPALMLQESDELAGEDDDSRVARLAPSASRARASLSTAPATDEIELRLHLPSMGSLSNVLIYC